jgi:hypothetical protein
MATHQQRRTPQLQRHLKKIVMNLANKWYLETPDTIVVPARGLCWMTQPETGVELPELFVFILMLTRRLLRRKSRAPAAAEVGTAADPDFTRMPPG